MCVSGVQYGGFWGNTCIANFINRTIVLVNVITFKWQNKAEAKKKQKDTLVVIKIIKPP